MGDARRIQVWPLDGATADVAIARWHYSGRAYCKSRIHYGGILDGRLIGVASLGEGIDSAKIGSLVEGTRADTYLELNRFALHPDAPRYSASRILSRVVRRLRRDYREIGWLVSYADGCQSGRGTIYQALGWHLTQVRRNTTLYRAPWGIVISDVGIRTSARLQRALGLTHRAARRDIEAAGCVLLEGYQLRYVCYLQEWARDQTRMVALPYSAADVVGEIDRRPARHTDRAIPIQTRLLW